MAKNFITLLLGVLLLGGLLFFYSSPLTLNKTSPVKDENEQRLLKDEKLEHVVNWAQNHLPQKGVLKEGGKGFVYLKVDDSYINQLFQMLPHSGYKKPEYFRRPDAPGAHISVFYEEERHQTGKIEEIGKEFSFTITGMTLVPPHTHEFIVLEVKAPQLEQLREKYGLSPLLKGHDFHITIAKKKRRHH